MALLPTRPVNLPLLDLGRFVAALLVAFFHVGITVTHFTGKIPFDGVFRAGHSGVAYFFVLSGFIILYVHRGDLGRPDRLRPFALKRVIRLVPVLWVTMIGWGAIRLYLPGGTLGALDPRMILYDCLLLPHRTEGVIGAVWTLRREVIFYLLFAIAIVNRRFGIGLLVAWQAAILLNLLHPFFTWGPEPEMLMGVHNLGFGVGLLLGLFLPARPLPRPALFIAAGVLLYAAVMMMEWRLGNPSHLDLIPLDLATDALLYFGASAIIVAGMVSLDVRAGREKTVTSALLGGSSYALYLTHGPITSVAIRLLEPLWPKVSAEVLALLLVAIAIIGGLATNLLFEKPIAAFLRSRSLRVDARS